MPDHSVSEQRCPEKARDGTQCDRTDLHDGDHEHTYRTADGFLLAKANWPQEWRPDNRAARRKRSTLQAAAGGRHRDRGL